MLKPKLIRSICRLSKKKSNKTSYHIPNGFLKFPKIYKKPLFYANHLFEYIYIYIYSCECFVLYKENQKSNILSNTFMANVPIIFPWEQQQKQLFFSGVLRNCRMRAFVRNGSVICTEIYTDFFG